MTVTRAVLLLSEALFHEYRNCLDRDGENRGKTTIYRVQQPTVGYGTRRKSP